ncbi:MAG: ribonuclease H-like domain-containing protein [Limisphaerales bacterium]
MKTIFFDIETGPLPEQELAQMVPPFDPNEVKVGNLKDPEKIAAKRAEAEANHHREFVERAALDPLTGRVLAVGLLSGHGDFCVISHEDEAAILREFWKTCRGGDMSGLNRMVCFNSHSFDLPFLIRRSFKYRIKIPLGIRRGRYWSDQMVDLREEWQLGDRQARGSLDSLARYFGVGQKNGQGHDFARLWRENRGQAMAYLRTDLELTAKIAEALGLAEPEWQLRNAEPVAAQLPAPISEQSFASESYSIVN